MDALPLLEGQVPVVQLSAVLVGAPEWYTGHAALTAERLAHRTRAGSDAVGRAAAAGGDAAATDGGAAALRLLRDVANTNALAKERIDREAAIAARLAGEARRAVRKRALTPAAAQGVGAAPLATSSCGGGAPVTPLTQAEAKAVFASLLPTPAAEPDPDAAEGDRLFLASLAVVAASATTSSDPAVPLADVIRRHLTTSCRGLPGPQWRPPSVADVLAAVRGDLAMGPPDDPSATLELLAPYAPNRLLPLASGQPPPRHVHVPPDAVRRVAALAGNHSHGAKLSILRAALCALYAPPLPPLLPAAVVGSAAPLPAAGAPSVQPVATAASTAAAVAAGATATTAGPPDPHAAPPPVAGGEGWAAAAAHLGPVSRAQLALRYGLHVSGDGSGAPQQQVCDGARAAHHTPAAAVAALLRTVAAHLHVPSGGAAAPTHATEAQPAAAAAAKQQQPSPPPLPQAAAAPTTTAATDCSQFTGMRVRTASAATAASLGDDGGATGGGLSRAASFAGGIAADGDASAPPSRRGSSFAMLTASDTAAAAGRSRAASAAAAGAPDSRAGSFADFSAGLGAIVDEVLLSTGAAGGGDTPRASPSPPPPPGESTPAAAAQPAATATAATAAAAPTRPPVPRHRLHCAGLDAAAAASAATTTSGSGPASLSRSNSDSAGMAAHVATTLRGNAGTGVTAVVASASAPASSLPASAPDGRGAAKPLPSPPSTTALALAPAAAADPVTSRRSISALLGDVRTLSILFTRGLLARYPVLKALPVTPTAAAATGAQPRPAATTLDCSLATLRVTQDLLAVAVAPALLGHEAVVHGGEDELWAAATALLGDAPPCFWGLSHAFCRPDEPGCTRSRAAAGDDGGSDDAAAAATLAPPSSPFPAAHRAAVAYAQVIACLRLLPGQASPSCRAALLRAALQCATLTAGLEAALLQQGAASSSTPAAVGREAASPGTGGSSGNGSAAGALSPHSAAHGLGVSADELMPRLCFALVAARLARVPSHLAAVEDGLPPGHEAGQDGYALVSLRGAAAHVLARARAAAAASVAHEAAATAGGGATSAHA